MKLAEALMERADLQNRLSALEGRLSANARVQEGEKPAESPEELMEELDRAIGQLEALCARINLTNSRTVSEGETLTELLSRRDCHNNRLRILRDFLQEASSLTNRMTRSEIKIVSTVDVSATQKRVDALSKQLRELDVRIQSLNWTCDLI